MTAVWRGIVAERGVLGLWSGATPSVLRLILLNSSMVATYDEVGRPRAHGSRRFTVPGGVSVVCFCAAAYPWEAAQQNLQDSHSVVGATALSFHWFPVAIA